MSSADQAEPYLDIYIGDEAVYNSQLAAYQLTSSILRKNAAMYGLPDKPEDLYEDQRQLLHEIQKDSLQFTSPNPLFAGRLVFTLDSAPGLAKTRANFIALCAGDKGMCKNAPNKALHYKGVPLHRIVKDFIAQGGDITRGDGSGGESIYGAKFPDAKEGLKNKFKLGSLAMANSGKNTNSSQFFITLTEDPTSLAKLDGKYVCFGTVKNIKGEGGKVLRRLNEVADPSGKDKPLVKVWIGRCGLLASG